MMPTGLMMYSIEASSPLDEARQLLHRVTVDQVAVTDHGLVIGILDRGEVLGATADPRSNVATLLRPDTTVRLRWAA